MSVDTAPRRATPTAAYVKQTVASGKGLRRLPGAAHQFLPAPSPERLDRDHKRGNGDPRERKLPDYIMKVVTKYAAVFMK